MPLGYGSQSEYMEWVRTEAADRQSSVEEALRSAFFHGSSRSGRSRLYCSTR